MDNLDLKGRYKIYKVFDDGTEELVQEVDNLVVFTGRVACLRNFTGQNPPFAISHIAVGTGSTAVAVGQSALVTEQARVVPAFSSIRLDNTDSRAKIDINGFFVRATVGVHLREVGLFLDAPVALGATVPTTNSMLSRTIIDIDNSSQTADLRVIVTLEA